MMDAMRHTTLVLLAALLAAGCRGAQPRGASADAPPAGAASTPLEDYRRILAVLREQQQQNDILRERYGRCQEEIADLYARLAIEQKLRREAELLLQSCKADAAAAETARDNAAKLQAALDQAQAQLAAAREELKNRREELMRIVLDQQQWNKYVLEKLKVPD